VIALLLAHSVQTPLADDEIVVLCRRARGGRSAQ